NECYIGPANENALPIVSDELTMTEYDPYMKDFKDGMYVQNRAPDNRYYLGTITYNSDLNMAIYKPTDKKGFEQAKLEQDKKDIRTIASFAADWTPADVAIDSASFIAGHDIITGEDCNRGILAAGILLPGGLDSLVKGLAKKGVKQASKHGDDVAEEAFKIGDDVYDVTKGAGKAVDDIFNNGKKVLDNFEIDNAYVKPKHLSTTKGKGQQFLGNNKVESEIILKDTIKNGAIKSITDNGITRAGNESYEIIIDAGKEIGTRGETLVKIVLSEDGGMLSAYPIK
ncbi:hypothetical protein, partial [Clostridium butyricum]|uniref:hypothetical protein n=1 Tax=Clostridium butyricum TaxID=1492 RepID=UPI0016520AA8